MEDRPSPAELATAAFYAWERRGRGWQEWQGAVDLEPPFRPFYGHFLASPVEIPDDGRQPGMFERLFGLAKSLAPSAPPPADDVAIEEPSPHNARETDYLDFILSIPREEVTDRDAVAHFLLSVASAQFPIAFEMLGTADEIRVVIACATEDRVLVSSQLQAFFPEIGIALEVARVLCTWGAFGSDDPRATALLDFGLANEFLYPLRSVKGFEPDPLIAITAALEELASEEVGLFQVLFTPTCAPWQGHALTAVSDGQGGCFFADAPEMLSEAKKKLASPLFAVAIRIGARAETERRAREIAWQLSSALNQFSSPLGNAFLPLSREIELVLQLDLLSRMSHRSGMLLNLEELVSLVHPPSASVRSPKLLRERKKTKAAPSLAAGHPMVLGENIHRGETRAVSVSQDNRMRHMHLIGASGTGKSTLLLSMILQDIEQGRGLAILDPHGDLVDETLRRIPESRLDDVVLLDPSDEEFPVALNILAAHTELQKILLSSDLVAVFRRLSTSWGDQMNSVLANAIQAFLESTEGGTLMDLRRFLLEEPFRKGFLSTVTDPDVVAYWKKAFPLLTGKPQGPILTRLDTFLRPKPVRYMVRQKETKIDFRAVMDKGLIFLGKLSEGAIGEENAALLGSLLVSKFQQVAMSRQDIKAEARRDFCLYIDEFHHFITPSLSGLLSGARKYRLGLVLAHQELKQLSAKDPEVFSAVLANPATRICFRVSDFDAKVLADGFTAFDATDLQSLGIGEAIGRIERAEFDFNLKTRPLPDLDPEEGEARRQEAIRRSRAKYARPKTEIDQEIRAAEAPAEPTPEEEPRPKGRRREPAPDARRADAVTAQPPPAPPTQAVAARTAAQTSLARPIPVPTSPAAPEALPQSTPPVAAAEVEVEKPKPQPLLAGKGGHEHKYIQELLRNWGEKQGFRATIEKAVLDGSGSIDVAFDRGTELVLACEISITTSVDHEIGNLQKCLAAGYAQVALVSMNEKTLKKAEEAAGAALVESDRGRVRFVTPQTLFASFDGGSIPAPHEEMVGGYRVKRSIAKSERREADGRARAISEILTKRVARKLNSRFVEPQ